MAALLLAAGACDSEGRPPQAVPEQTNATTAKAGAVYREAAEDAGLRFHYFSGAAGQFFFPETVGAGAALFDYDRDGDLDIYLVQGDSLSADAEWDDALIPVPADQPQSSRLFRNQLMESGSLRFLDVTDSAGVGAQGVGMGAAVGDVDNDGFPDLYVTRFGANILYRNRGDGTFEDVTRLSEAGVSGWSTSATFFDYDADGDLDLYVVRYVNFQVAVNPTCASANGIRDYCGPQEFTPASDKLMRNEGGGRFKEVTDSAGISRVAGPGLGAVAADYDRDGLLDVYVANDGAANQLWINKGAGRFEDAGLLSGSAYNIDGQEEAGMGVTAEDFDDDGDVDLFVAHQATETNTLYVNDGAGGFVDRTLDRGLGSPSLVFTGFGCGWTDFDNDGDLDLVVANGAVKAEEALLGRSPLPYQQPNQLFEQLSGTRFVDITSDSGFQARGAETSRAAAFGDIDNDGDIDVVVTNQNAPVRLWLNEIGARNAWLRVVLTGTKSNRDGAGAQVAVLRASAPPLWRRAHRDGSYLAASDIRVHFGLGDNRDVEGVAVRWPSGQAEIWREGVGANKELHLREGDGSPWTPPSGASGGSR